MAWPYRLVLVLLLCAPLLQLPYKGALADPPDDSIADLQSKLKTALAENRDLRKIIVLLNLNVDALKASNDSTVRIAAVSHYVDTMKQIEAVYNWQIFASNISLALVSLIVLAGVAFAGFQLWQASRLGQPQAESQLEVSASNFRITSSTVGVVVLALSFFFFYLFVKEIYVINPPAQVPVNEGK